MPQLRLALHRPSAPLQRPDQGPSLDMYLNNVGIRKIARFVGASPAGVLRWIRKEHAALTARLAEARPDPQPPGDVIEMDEIYTFVQKKQRAVIWTAFSRRQNRVIAYHIGDTGVTSAMAIYRRVKQAVGPIEAIFTDANSCYRLAFARMDIGEPHRQTKAQTHLIKASNSSIRDNLARFNRRSKRFSKTLKMLDVTLTLFFNRHLITSPM
jgi:IS1 family transposase